MRIDEYLQDASTLTNGVRIDVESLVNPHINKLDTKFVMLLSDED